MDILADGSLDLDDAGLELLDWVLVSLHSRLDQPESVATERASLEKVDRQIADTRDDIAKIEMEIGVRARMGQLESWNREVLAPQAPRPKRSRRSRPK